MADLKARSLEGRGTDESVWLTCPELRRLDPCSLELPGSGRVVVIAPHPDDEVLGAGGTTATLGLQGARIVLVAVTDGEASAPGRAEELRKLRPRESARAAAALGTTPYLSYALGLPDGRVRAHDVEALLVPLLEPGDLVLAPWAARWSSRPRRGGLGRSMCVCGSGARLLAYLVWAWHWAQPWRAAVGEGLPGRTR